MQGKSGTPYQAGVTATTLTVDATMGTVRASVHLGSAVDLDVRDVQLGSLQVLDLQDVSSQHLNEVGGGISTLIREASQNISDDGSSVAVPQRWPQRSREDR